MNFQDYLKATEYFWKEHEDFEDELLHCLFALPEEFGEISGWYKKHFGYGLPKDEKWLTELKGEHGDVLYYTVTLARITGNIARLEAAWNQIINETVNLAQIEEYHFKKELTLIHSCFTKTEHLYEANFTGEEYEGILTSMFLLHCILMDREGLTLEDVALSNLRKLNTRHGKKFNQDKTVESNRDRDSESKSLSNE